MKNKTKQWFRTGIVLFCLWTITLLLGPGTVLWAQGEEEVIYRDTVLPDDETAESPDAAIEDAGQETEDQADNETAADNGSEDLDQESAQAQGHEAKPAPAPESVGPSSGPSISDLPLTEEQQMLIRMNKSMKNLVEENQKLLNDREAIRQDIERLRGERVIQDNRLNALARERTYILKKSEEIDKIKQDYEKRIAELEEKVKRKEATGELRKAYDLEDLIAQDEVEAVASVPPADGTQASSAAAQPAPTTSEAAPAPTAKDDKANKKKVRETSKEFSALMEENQVLRKDTVRLHYNLANLFFEQGKYELSAAEYARVIDLMPQDAASHYNLALVSQDYLGDYETAYRHYKTYLQLSPEAKDADLVKKRMLDIKLKLQAKINSILDKEPKPDGK